MSLDFGIFLEQLQEAPSLKVVTGLKMWCFQMLKLRGEKAYYVILLGLRLFLPKGNSDHSIKARQSL